MATNETLSKHTVLRIATRKSKLALWQANHVATLIKSQFGMETELVPIVTQGDRIQDVPLSQVGGKGLFLKEIESAILEDQADLAVHSMKDVPSYLPVGLTLGALLPREDPTDALIGAKHLDDLRQGAIIGTSSLRRQAQLQAYRADFQIKSIRGNIDTRLEKLHAGNFDAIVLSTAGLIRLNLEHHIGQILPKTICLPAVSQGCIGIECRSSDTALLELLQQLQDSSSTLVLTAERACNAALGGSCQAPIAVHGTLQGEQLTLEAMVGDLEGNLIRSQATGRITTIPAAQALGESLAHQLYDQGAKALLKKTIAKS